jgi:translation initiation factor IF-3
VNTPLYRTNNQIQAKEVRLLREDGTQIGVVPLSEALSQAKSNSVDAVEIAASANPPVVKLIDYKKFLYQLSKKEQAAKSASKKVDIKEIRLTPFMAQNDFQVKVDRGREFLLDGHKLRICVKFVGRQLNHREFGDTMFSKAQSSLSDISRVDQAPKWVGRQFIGTLTPVKNKTKNQNEQSQN